MFLTAQRVPLRLQVFAFSSSAAEKVPIPQFKGPTGPASMIDSLEKRTRVLKGGEEGGEGRIKQQLSDYTELKLPWPSPLLRQKKGEARSSQTGIRAEMD